MVSNYMNKEIALKILEINKNDNLSYEEKISQMENIAGTGIETHTNINTGGTYGKRNCYILEAYKFVAEAENPHCGTIPTIPPIKGPTLPDF